MPEESQSLHNYLEIIKNIDIEQSMESIVELMNMLRLIFPMKFLRIKQEMFDMYDPITNRSFGLVFHALMNILRDKSKRDRLHTIFQELMIPHSLKEHSHQDSATHAAQAAETPESTSADFGNPLPKENSLVEQFQEPASGTMGTETDEEEPSEKPINSSQVKSVIIEESDQPLRYSSPMRRRRLKTSGILPEGQKNRSSFVKRKSQHSAPKENIVDERPEEPTPSDANQEFSGETKNSLSGRLQNSSELRTESEKAAKILEAKRREIQSRQENMRNFLYKVNKVKKNNAVPVSLQMKAAMISKALAEDGVAASKKIPVRSSSRRIERE